MCPVYSPFSFEHLFTIIMLDIVACTSQEAEAVAPPQSSEAPPPASQVNCAIQPAWRMPLLLKLLMSLVNQLLDLVLSENGSDTHIGVLLVMNQTQMTAISLAAPVNLSLILTVSFLYPTTRLVFAFSS
jgi:hypothetical protein